MPSDDSSERKGVNYEIAVLRLEYKNMDTIEGKRVVVEQKKDEARAHMQNKEYLEAIRIYRYLYDINSNCSKKHFSENEGVELEALSNNARANFLKVFFKLVETDPSASKEFAELAESSIKHLLAKQSNDNVIHFLNAKWELRQRNLQSALDAAKKSYSIKATAEAAKLF